MKTIRIRVVMFQESGWWCAQCLEYDIATQAPTIEKLKQELELALTVHADLALERGQEPFQILPRAPERYFQMYDAFERSNGAEDVKSFRAPSNDADTCINARFAYPQLAGSFSH